MKQIIDFGDTVILKKSDLIERVREVRPEECEEMEKNFHI